MRDGIPERPAEIAFLRFGGIGEILAITPALAAIRKRWPQARMIAMVPRKAREILDRLEVVDEYLFAEGVYSANSPVRLCRPSAIAQLAGLARRLRSRPPDMLLIFNHLYYHRSVLKPALLSWLSRAPVRVGFDSYGRGFFLTHRVADDRWEDRHLVDRNREFLAALHIDAAPERPLMVITDEDRAEAARVLAAAGVAPEAALLACNPGSSRPASRWFADRFADVVRSLRARYGLVPLLLGRPEEAPLCDLVIRMAGCGVNLAGRTSLHGLAALLSRVAILVSNDTGTIHIAAAVGAPTVAVFGPGEFSIWGTYRYDNFRAVRHDVECSPCIRYTCGHHTCMRMVRPEDVLAAATELLKR